MEQTLEVAHGAVRRARLRGGDDGRDRRGGRRHQAAALQLLRQQGAALHRLHGAGGRRADRDDCRDGRRDRQSRRRARGRRPRLLLLPRHRPLRLGGALRRDPPPGRRGLRPRRRLPRPDPRPRLRLAAGADARAQPGRGQGRSRGPLHRPARRLRGARALVAADRGDQRRGRRRAPHLHRRARPARALDPHPTSNSPQGGPSPK